MRHNTDRILVSHAGNLPRPADLNHLLAARDGPGITRRLPGAVNEIVDRQIACGVDIVNDGEYVKAGSYTGYMQQRVSGWEVLPIDPNVPRKRAGVAERDRRQFPGFYESGLWMQGSGGPIRPGFFTPGAPKPATTECVCTGPVKYTAQTQIQSDLRIFKNALQGKVADGFVAALGPLSLGAGKRNTHYPSEEAYMTAVAEAVREEYRAPRVERRGVHGRHGDHHGADRPRAFGQRPMD